MTEEERQSVIEGVISVWMPVSWPVGGSRYTILSVTLTGDSSTGGVELLVDKDGATATISFTNEECYGGTPMTSGDALARVYAGTYT